MNHNTAWPLARLPRSLPAAVGVMSPSLRWFISVKWVDVLTCAVSTVGKEGALCSRWRVEIHNVVNAIVLIVVSSHVFWTRFTYVMFCVAACYFSWLMGLPLIFWHSLWFVSDYLFALCLLRFVVAYSGAVAILIHTHKRAGLRLFWNLNRFSLCKELLRDNL